MKTFKDLEFDERIRPFGGSRAVIEFENEYGLSIVEGHGCYQDEGTYEVGILHEGSLTYDTSITDDVLSYQSVEDIEKLMVEVQNLKKQ